MLLSVPLYRKEGAVMDKNMQEEFVKFIGRVAVTAISLFWFYCSIIIGLLFSPEMLSQRTITIFGIICIALYVKILLHVWGVRKYGKVKKPLMIVGSLATVLLIGSWGFDLYVDSIPTIAERETLQDYQPFKGEMVAELEEPTTLSITEDLPIIDCATAFYPLVGAFVQATYPEAEYSYDSYHSSRGPVACSKTPQAYESLINGKVDIILVLEPSKEQMQAAEEAGVELTLTPIGKEAFVFFNNEKNPVEGISVEQVKGIYSGEITNWQEVGGNSEKVRAFQRGAGSGSQTALVSMMGDIPLMPMPKGDVEYLMGGMIERVADYKNFKNAMGFSFRYYATQMVENNQIRLLKINDVYPDKETIRDESYPFTSTFYAVTAGTDNPHVEELIQWILSPQGQELIEKTGYVGIN